MTDQEIRKSEAYRELLGAERGRAVGVMLFALALIVLIAIERTVKSEGPLTLANAINQTAPSVAVTYLALLCIALYQCFVLTRVRKRFDVFVEGLSQYGVSSKVLAQMHDESQHDPIVSKNMIAVTEHWLLFLGQLGRGQFIRIADISTLTVSQFGGVLVMTRSGECLNFFWTIPSLQRRNRPDEESIRVLVAHVKRRVPGVAIEGTLWMPTYIEGQDDQLTQLLKLPEDG